ncbi:MAG: SDR family oxidoreductase [Bacteroidota bacterium]
MKTAIVTGVTGFIGSRVACKLLKCGWSVHALGRGKAGYSFSKRVISAIDNICGFPLKREIFENLHCHEVDICKDDLGLQNQNAAQQFGTNAILFHIAGDTRFKPPSPEAQFKINVTGSLNVIQTLRNSLASVVHVSTAYVAGRRQGIVMEDELDEGQELRNNYEKTKLKAEIEVTKLCRELGIPLSITRPSIIINDSVTGRSPTLTHFNALVDVITRIQLHFKNNKNEIARKEIRIPVTPNAYPNLAPVNPVVDALIEIGTNTRAHGKTFHLCHPAPQPNSEIMNILVKAFHVKDRIRLSFVDEIPQKLSWTEEMMLRSLKQYLPYLNEYCTFDVTNTKSIIPDYDSWLPSLTYDYMEKVIFFQRHRQFKRSHG